MLDVLAKIVVGLFILSAIAWFAGYGVIFYKAATGDDEFFARKVYIVNQDFCKEKK